MHPSGLLLQDGQQWCTGAWLYRAGTVLHVEL